MRHSGFPMKPATGIAALLVLCACATAPDPVPPREERPASPGPATSFEDALRRELAREGPLEGFRLRVDWRESGLMSTVEVRADGLGIWDGRAQFRASPGQVRNLAIALRD